MVSTAAGMYMSLRKKRNDVTLKIVQNRWKGIR